jgi:hypothetical protein
MTIQQTIDVPASRKVHLDIILPEDMPCGQTDVILDFKPSTVHDGTSGKAGLDPVLEKALKEAAERAERERTDPLYRQRVIDSFQKAQEGGPIFGGISAEDFKRD